MAYKTGINRHQVPLIPLSLEESIGADNIVRIIDAFVDCLDLSSLGFDDTVENVRGASKYAPTTMLKLYIYGYLNRIRSSRRLALECARNIELHWLLCQLTPQYHTIADFRKDNACGLKNVFKTFTQFCLVQNLIGGDTAAIDGTKIRAQNNQKNNFNSARLEKLLNRIDAKTQEYEQYLKDLDNQDACDMTDLSMPSSKTKADIEKTLNILKERRIEYQSYQLQLQKAIEEGCPTEDLQISTVDPDARSMSFKAKHTEVGYNIQTVGDAKHSLVVHFEVTNVHDQQALSGIAIATKEVLQLQPNEGLKVLADAGYHTGSQLSQCAQHNIQTYVCPADITTTQGKIGHQPTTFTKDQFIYNADEDVYICPNKQKLTTNGTWYERKATTKRRLAIKYKQYTLPSKTCQTCPFSEQCQGNRKKHWHGKTIDYTEYEKAVQDNQQNLRLNPKAYQQRKEIIEHPFGTIKRAWGYNYTLLKTKQKVTGEFALIYLCYNLRRVSSILGIKGLIDALKTMKSNLIQHIIALIRLLNFYNLKTSSQIGTPIG
jgi:radical SAM protein with 4Fe4S-binding SPASM domain